ncbi:MAG: spermidine synthase, partial [candidate division WS1 bacterium]|nr:spermidine synthase [candidate division WS1 bacterium]
MTQPETATTGTLKDYRRGVILVLFLLSGIPALAYEIVWVRMLTLVFGATVLSVGSVLASYMLGLALGAWYWSRRADRLSRPLRLYAVLEAGVAVTALLTPLMFRGVEHLYRALFVGGVSDFSTLSLARLLLCLPVLLLPTFLMGGTLPVLVR